MKGKARRSAAARAWPRRSRAARAPPRPRRRARGPPARGAPARGSLGHELRDEDVLGVVDAELRQPIEQVGAHLLEVRRARRLLEGERAQVGQGGVADAWDERLEVLLLGGVP